MMITAGNCNEKGNNPRRMVMVRMTTLTITITLVMTIAMTMVSNGNGRMLWETILRIES